MRASHGAGAPPAPRQVLYTFARTCALPGCFTRRHCTGRIARLDTVLSIWLSSARPCNRNARSRADSEGLSRRQRRSGCLPPLEKRSKYAGIAATRKGGGGGRAQLFFGPAQLRSPAIPPGTVTRGRGGGGGGGGGVRSEALRFLFRIRIVSVSLPNPKRCVLPGVGAGLRPRVRARVIACARDCCARARIRAREGGGSLAGAGRTFPCQHPCKGCEGFTRLFTRGLHGRGRWGRGGPPPTTRAASAPWPTAV
jgi:hypothetical protein